MTTYDIHMLKKDLERSIDLENRDIVLIEDAISAGGSSSKAECALEMLLRKFEKEGNKVATDMIKKVLGK